MQIRRYEGWLPRLFNLMREWSLWLFSLGDCCGGDVWNNAIPSSMSYCSDILSTAKTRKQIYKPWYHCASVLSVSARPKVGLWCMAACICTTIVKDKYMANSGMRLLFFFGQRGYFVID